ncbi:MAG TPA: bifunctional nuclease family protein, partial [Candidatus Omnitrophota bacterium]|nr:bifunctional nuclease family protein [Candidatus Omnitrophota bacterium]
ETRYLPLVIGIAEINSIKLNLSGVKPPRPMTHDLLVNILEGLGARLEKVVIDKIEKNTFYAKLFILKEGGNRIIMDARPSDSVAIALRCGVPIFAKQDVLNAASVAEV